MRGLKLMWLAVVMLPLAGCNCRSGLIASLGDVAYVMTEGGDEVVAAQGVYDFGFVPMGTSQVLDVVLRNRGRGALTVTRISKRSGAASEIGTEVEAASVFRLSYAAGTEVAPSMDSTFRATFTPPLTAGARFVDYDVVLELEASNTEAETAVTSLLLRGRATANGCSLPETLDFGSVLVRSKGRRTVTFDNQTLDEVQGFAGAIASATGDAVFAYEPTSPAGELLVGAGESRELGIVFTPTETRDYAGAVNLRRSKACPVQRVRLVGRGVSSCLSYTAAPTDSATADRLHFGPVLPGLTGQGSVTFSNTCALPVALSSLMTSPSVFAVVEAGADVTTHTVPAAMLDATGLWRDGTAVAKLTFAPTTIGASTGVFALRTSLVGQPTLSVQLRGAGGGPEIEVRPGTTLNFGRIGYFAGATPPTTAQRTVLVSNVGLLPTPRDVMVNLRLGGADGSSAFSVRAIAGEPSELCVGDYDSGQGCLNRLPPRYDATVGLEALAGTGLPLPIRVVPQSTGLKEWEVTLFSNDPDEPEVRLTVRADVQVLPPCNYEVTPSTMAFGLVNPLTPKTQTFTLRNLGQRATDICYLSGFEMTPDSDASFSLAAGLTDPLELLPGTEVSIGVSSAPTSVPGVGTLLLSGRVTFNAPNPLRPTGLVELTATLAPTCLTVTPISLDFGRVEEGCFSPDRALQVFNACATTVTLDTYEMTAPSTVPMGTGDCMAARGCDEFQLTSAPANFAGPLAPGASRVFTFKYHPYDLGSDTGTFTLGVTQAGAPVDYHVSLRGLAELPLVAGQCSLTTQCPAPISVDPNTTVTLQPSINSSGGGAVACAWSTAQRPASANGDFGSPDSCQQTSYFADVVGTHVLRFNATDASGRMSSCDTTVTVQPRGELWIELTWDIDNDMDLHLLHPQGGSSTSAASWGGSQWDCYFGNCTSSGFSTTPSWDNPGTQDDPSLDRDDIPGRGPENTRINVPSRAHPYTIGVHMYSNVSGMPVTSTLKVYCAGQLVTTQVRTLSVRKDMWVVGTVDFSNPGTQGCVFTPGGTVIPMVP